jgi:hypothetical protein
LCFSQRMDLSGAFSNPRVLVELCDLSDLKLKLLSQRRPPKRFTSRIKPRTRVPIVATVTQVLVVLANHESVTVKDIHAACEELLGRPVSYKSLKTGLAEHCRSQKPRFVKVSRGKYRLTD